MRSVKLSEDELLHLDGKVSDEVQKEIDALKRSRTYTSDPWVGAIVTKALEDGKLTVHRRSLSSCQKCKTRPGYAKYKSGPRKGQSNYAKELCIHGYSFCDGFCILRNYSSLGFCQECGTKLLADVRGILLANDLPVEFEDSLWVVEPMRECYACKALMGEFDMGMKHTLMGDGLYPAGCPSCGAESVFFGLQHKRKGQRVVRKTGLKQVKNIWERVK